MALSKARRRAGRANDNGRSHSITKETNDRKMGKDGCEIKAAHYKYFNFTFISINEDPDLRLKGKTKSCSCT
jgi:hypothetical protein